MSEVKIIVTRRGDYGERADIDVFVDGERVAGGHVGGEPEDNTVNRDYSWIAPAFKTLAGNLGALAIVDEVDKTGDEEDDS